MDYLNLATRIQNYEDCLMGVGQTHDNSFFIYDREKILQKIMRVAQCDYKKALEFFDVNININYGRRGPVFFSNINQIDV